MNPTIIVTLVFFLFTPLCYGSSEVLISEWTSRNLSIGILGRRDLLPSLLNFSDHSPKKWPGFKMDLPNAAALSFSVFGAILANAAGVGGGGMFVPMFTILGFDTKTATALSQAMITGGALTSFLFNVRLQHPTLPKPLIDYDVALLLEPMLLLGISVGVIFSIVFPSWLIVLLLSLLLSYMAWRTSLRGLSAWSKESALLAAKRSNQLAEVSRDDPEGSNSAESQGNEAESDDEGSGDEREDMDEGVEPAAADVISTLLKSPEVSHGQSQSPFLIKQTAKPLQRLKAFWMSETSIIPKWKLAEVLLVWISFLCLQILKGGRGSSSTARARSCLHRLWVLIGLQIPLCGAFTYRVAQRLYHEHRTRPFAEAMDTSEDNSAIQWRSKSLTLYPLVALVAGALAGLLGIGGGMVIGPLLLEIGIAPQVTAATGAMMVLFSSSMAVAQFSILQRIPLEYALVYGGVCAVSAYVGLVGVRVMTSKYGRTSIIIFALAIVIAASAIVIMITGGVSILEDIMRHKFMGFEPLCSPHS